MQVSYLSVLMSHFLLICPVIHYCPNIRFTVMIRERWGGRLYTGQLIHLELRLVWRAEMFQAEADQVHDGVLHQLATLLRLLLLLLIHSPAQRK